MLNVVMEKGLSSPNGAESCESLACEEPSTDVMPVSVENPDIEAVSAVLLPLPAVLLKL